MLVTVSEPDIHKDPECTLIADLSHFSRLSPRVHREERGEKIALAPTFATFVTKYSRPSQRIAPPEASEVTSCFTARCDLLQTFERNGEWVATTLRSRHHGWHHSRCQVGHSKASVIRRLRKGRLRRRLRCFPWSRRGVLPPVASICATGKAARAACAKGGNLCLRIDPEEAKPPTYVTQPRKNPPIGVASAQDSRVPGDGEDLCME